MTMVSRSFGSWLWILTLSGPSPMNALASPQRSVAIVTGGTRGIGSGIAAALADAGYDLLLTYNTNQAAAHNYAAKLGQTYTNCQIECVGGDLSLVETRDAIFACLEDKFPRSSHALKAFVHNAGQYVGVTSDNADGLGSEVKKLGSLLRDDGSTDLSTLRYYQKLYGDAWIDGCERALARMVAQATQDNNPGGTLIGVSSPSVTAHLYGPDPSYSMPGAGKCVMEYTSRVYAKHAAQHGITVNIVIPGLVKTEAWKRLAQSKGLKDETALMQGVLDNGPPIKEMLEPRDMGNVVAFLCSPAGRFITGMVLPADGGLHLVR